MKLAKRLMAKRGGGWTPTEIAIELWLDAADAATITIVDGLVSAWADKSGNSRNAAQSAPIRRPVLSGSGLVFTSDRLVIPVSGMPVSDYSIMALMQSTSTGSTYAGFVCATDTSLADPEIRLGVSNDVRAYLNGGYAISSNGSARTLGILDVSVSGSAETALVRNGTRLTGSTRTGSLSALSDFNIGYFVGGANSGYRNGTIYELLVYNTTVTNRQMLEGYLAHKWDALLGVTTLVSALPSDHPYKSTAP